MGQWLTNVMVAGALQDYLQWDWGGTIFEIWAWGLDSVQQFDIFLCFSLCPFEIEIIIDDYFYPLFRVPQKNDMFFSLRQMI